VDEATPFLLREVAASSSADSCASRSTRWRIGERSAPGGVKKSRRSSKPEGPATMQSLAGQVVEVVHADDADGERRCLLARA
jgi:hypothetical protein